MFPGLSISLRRNSSPERPLNTDNPDAQGAAAPAGSGGAGTAGSARGAAARLKPLIHADGLAEIDAAAGNLEPGDKARFHPFQGGFSDWRGEY